MEADGGCVISELAGTRQPAMGRYARISVHEML